MPFTSFDLQELVKNTNLTYIAAEKDSGRNANVQINTPRLIIKSITLDDVDFMQSLWANEKVMETFAANTCRFYCGTMEEQQLKAANEAPYDYAKWRIVDMDNSWLKRLAAGNIWSGYIVCLKETSTKIGHLIIGGGELAYFFHPDFWKKGYATEAVVVFVKIAVPKLIQDYKVPSPANQIYPHHILASIGAEVVRTKEASWKILQYAGFSLTREREITHLGDAPVKQYEREMWQAAVSIEKLIKDYNTLLCSVASSPDYERPLPSPTSSKVSWIVSENGCVKTPLLTLKVAPSKSVLVRDNQNVSRDELLPRTKAFFVARLLGVLYYIFVAPIIFLLSPLLMLFMTFNIKLSLNLGGMLAFAGAGVKHYFTIKKAYKLLKQEHRKKVHVNSLIKARDNALNVATVINQSDLDAKSISATQQESTAKIAKMVICDSSEDKRKDTEQESTTACQETLTMSGNFEEIQTASPENADNHALRGQGDQEPNRAVFKN